MGDLRARYKRMHDEDRDENNDYYVEHEEFERVDLRTVKNGYKRRDGVHLPDLVRNLSLVKHMELRDDDVFSIGFPKSGTTWLEEILWLLLNNFDFDKAREVHHYMRVTVVDSGHSKRRLDEIVSPRLFKTHLQLKFLPDDLTKRAKVVYILRNPKDVIASTYKFFGTFLMNQFVGTLDELVDMFVEGTTMYGAWYDHVNAYTNLAGVHVIHYEDLVEDPYNEIKQLAAYVDKNPSESQIKSLLEYISFENLKNSRSCDLANLEVFTTKMVFFNQGKIGNWKNHLTEEMSKKVDDMMATKVTYKRRIQFEPTIKNS